MPEGLFWAPSENPPEATMDLLCIAVILLLFALTGALVAGCERLRKSS
jgi:hypothetical protein